MTEELKSLAGQFFYGNLDESSLFPFPVFTSDERELLQELTNGIKKFGQSINVFEIDEKGFISKELLQTLADMGLCGLAVSEEHGGLGLSTPLYCKVFEEIAHIDGAIATTLGAHQSIGYRALINE